jgi:hypothetical protein
LQRQANIAVYFREEKHLSASGLAEINALRKQFDLAAEMGIDERLRYAQLAGDVVESRAAEAAFVEELDRLLENAFPFVG